MSWNLDWSPLMHAAPRWLQDAKFGLFFHWGVYSVPACENEWYSRNMYLKGCKQNLEHERRYGKLSEFGYKDFIPSFRAERFDPDAWAELVELSGARYAGPVSEHADNYSLWDSRVNPINSVRTGPHRDIAGECAAAFRRRGIRYLATFHHQWLWGWFMSTDNEADVYDPANEIYYGPALPLETNRYQPYRLPDKAFCDVWLEKIREVAEGYRPDVMYFDGRVMILPEEIRYAAAKCYYDAVPEGIITYKQTDFPKGLGVFDVECGRFADRQDFFWQTDDRLEDRVTWCIVQDPKYKPAGRIIQQIADVASKNGTLVLNVGPQADGTFHPDAVRELKRIGQWLKTNGEAIYGTRPITSALNHIGRRRLDMLDANLQADETGEIDYFGRCSEKFFSTLDVAGYNYLFRRYGKDLEIWPGRFICGTESVAKEAYASWQETLKHPRVIGDFAWAAMDYLGEAGIGHIWRRPEDGEGYFERWPWRQANCGDLDLTGFRTPAGFYRRAVWGMPEGPYIAVRPPEWEEDGLVSYWVWPPREPAWDYPGYEGRPVLVEVYSPEKEVTLTLNGQPVGKKSCEACAAAFTLAYQPGIIRAADAAGRETELRTPGPAAGIRLSAEDRGELIFFTATLTDGEGTPCFFDHRKISFQAAGGTLLGVGSADPASEEGFRSGKARAWRGRVSAVVRRGEGPVTVRASAPRLSEAVYTLPGP